MRPILIYGPTASGKSALGLKLAEHFNSAIVNADALQVYANWQILSARPSNEEIKQAPHHLYGHVDPDHSYSVGDWLSDIKSTLSTIDQHVIIIGGTGLYLKALTQGLADIPKTPDAVRDAGNAMRTTYGASGFLKELESLDPDILTRIDKNNPMRLQRAWEVVKATGKALSAWQADTAPPIVPPETAHLICLTAPADWQRNRIDQRFDVMVEMGALAECEAELKRGWNPDLPASQAIGAAQLIAHIRGEISLDAAITLAKTATHQFAKRQRTWSKNQMKSWACQNSDNPNLFAKIIEQIENSASKLSADL